MEQDELNALSSKYKAVFEIEESQVKIIFENGEVVYMTAFNDFGDIGLCVESEQEINAFKENSIAIIGPNGKVSESYMEFTKRRIEAIQKKYSAPFENIVSALSPKKDNPGQ